jgi:hypothetical protein
VSVWYLDDKDEITDAVARLRDSEDDEVVLVVPAGSRIATGRINFRLLAKEAASRDKTLAIVSTDEQVRALVAAAGVLGHATVAEAEAALERGDVAPEPAPPTESDDADAATAAANSASLTSGSRHSRRRLATATLGIVIGLVVVGGVAAVQVLPTAHISIRPHTQSVGPIAVAVAAATNIDEVDVEAGEIPAVALSIPLRVEDSFRAGGTDAVESRATGEVLFSSTDQSFDQDIAAGTRVETAGGVAFRTIEPVVLRRPPGGSGPAGVHAPIEALAAGPDGNVVAGAISVVSSLQSQGIGVTNEEATAGGDRQESSVVTSEAYDAAAIDLVNRLGGELVGQLRDPANLPEGLTLFAETARVGPVTHVPAAEDIVGTLTDEFSLTAMATAQVLAVDESLVDAVAVGRLAAEAPNGSALVPATITTEAGAGTARGEVIRYAAIAEGDAYVLVDPEALREEIRGLPISEARSILEEFGTATVTVWPDFLGDLPSDGGRITLDIEDPAGTE